MKGLIQANLQLLKQGKWLLSMLSDQSYSRSEPKFYNSTVGGHLRHCLDHYEAFIEGAASEKMNYDARCRDQDVENKTESAGLRIDEIVTALENLAEEGTNRGVMVKMDCGTSLEDGKKDDLCQPSSLGRELQFLVSHTVHHFAMIRGLCQKEKITFPEAFGVAPSTTKYRKQLNKGMTG